ncbi:MAG: hypothetical protein AB7I19_00600 [Planctomycetota bacterium]
MTSSIVGLALLAARVLHPGPSVGIEFVLEERQVIIRVMGEQTTLAHWLGKAAPDDPWEEPITEPERSRVVGAIMDLVTSRNQIEIDGRTGPPTLTKLEVPPLDATGYGRPALSFELTVPIEHRPQSIRIGWKVWDHLSWYGEVKLPLMFREFGETALGVIAAAEPEFVWYSSSLTPRIKTAPSAVMAPPNSAGWPLSSILVLAGFGAAAFGLRKQPLGRLLWTGMAVSAIASAWLVRDLWRVDFSAPAASVPTDPARATEIVDRLVQNLYSAFDARREEEIYESLTVSVVPELVDELYGQIYESLILRNQGGALCQIEGIDFEDRRVNLTAAVEPWEALSQERVQGTRFLAEWNWTTRGLVSHWGHAHRRANRYETRLWICLDRGAWRIGSFEVLDLARTDSDG